MVKLKRRTFPKDVPKPNYSLRWDSIPEGPKTLLFVHAPVCFDPGRRFQASPMHCFCRRVEPHFSPTILFCRVWRMADFWSKMLKRADWISKYEIWCYMARSIQWPGRKSTLVNFSSICYRWTVRLIFYSNAVSMIWLTVPTATTLPSLQGQTSMSMVQRTEFWSRRWRITEKR